MPSNKERNDYFNSKEVELNLIKNESLKCKDCENVLNAVASCVIFQVCKPLSVLEGGECEYYELKCSGSY